MKIVVFGGSRGVGWQVVTQALEAGYTVTAFVRSPEKFETRHKNLIVFKGDAMDASAVENAIIGQDSVVSALGPTRPPVPHMMATSAINIVAGMKKHGVRRLISTTGAGVRQPEDEPKFVDIFIKPEYRGKGLGKAILDKLIADACSVGYVKLRLDSPTAFTAAHKLYESRSFRYIDAYEGSEAAEKISDFAVFMELAL